MKASFQMPTKSEATSSSEDEALIERLKEAVSTYEHSVTTEKSANRNDSNRKTSKRFAEKDEADSDDFAPTPEFQEHVARKLKSKLDE